MPSTIRFAATLHSNLCLVRLWAWPDRILGLLPAGMENPPYAAIRNRLRTLPHLLISIKYSLMFRR